MLRCRPALSLATFAAAAILGRPAIAAEPMPLQLEVIRNGEPTGLIAAFTQEADGRLSTTPGELKALGLTPPPGDGPVMLDRIEGLSFTYDETQQRLFLIVEPQALAPQRFSLRGSRRGGVAPSRDTGLVVNYSLGVHAGHTDEADSFELDGASGVFDGRAFGRFGLVTASATLEATAHRTRAVRLDTAWTLSLRDDLVTWRAGDLISGGFSWTRPMRMGGIQWRRDFGVRPDIVTVPTPTLKATAAAPSSLDVMLGSSVIYSRKVGPGEVSVSDLPIIQGQGRAQLVLRDAAGLEQRVTAAYFATPDLLAKGVTDFSVEVGFARRNYGLISNDYQLSPMASASVRRGVSQTVTVQGHAEAAERLALAGGGIVAAVADRALVSLAAAASHAGGDEGALIAAAFETRTRRVVLQAQVQQTFGRYADLAAISAQSRWTALGFEAGRTPRSLIQAALSGPIALKGLDRFGQPPEAALSYARVVEADGRTRSILNASLRWRVGERVNLQAAGYRTGGGHGVFLGLSLPLGGRHSAAAGMNIDRGRSGGFAEVRRLEEARAGDISWRLRVDRQADTALQGDVVYRSPFGRLEAQAAYARGDVRLDARVDGALIWLEAPMAAPERVEGAFAVIDVGAPGVEVRHQHRAIGRSGPRGRLLALNLNPYEDNVLDLAVEKAPIHLATPVTRRVVSPPYGAGALVRFGAGPAPTQVSVSIRMAGGRPAPAGARASLNGGPADIFVGYDGLVFLTAPQPINRLTVLLGDGFSCEAVVALAPTSKGLVHAPDTVCR